MQKVHIGLHGLVAVNRAPHLKTATVIKHVEERKCRSSFSEPMVGRDIKLPKLPYGASLPATNVRGQPRRFGRCNPLGADRPVSDLRSGQFQPKEPFHFARHKRIAIACAKSSLRERLDVGWPARSVVSARDAGLPCLHASFSSGPQKFTAKLIEPSRGYSK